MRRSLFSLQRMLDEELREHETAFVLSSSGKTSETPRYARGATSGSGVSEKLLPPRPEIGKAGINVEDEDKHGILSG